MTPTYINVYEHRMYTSNICSYLISAYAAYPVSNNASNLSLNSQRTYVLYCMFRNKYAPIQAKAFITSFTCPPTFRNWCVPRIYGPTNPPSHKRMYHSLLQIYGLLFFFLFYGFYQLPFNRYHHISTLFFVQTICKCTKACAWILLTSAQHKDCASICTAHFAGEELNGWGREISSVSLIVRARWSLVRWHTHHTIP